MRKTDLPIYWARSLVWGLLQELRWEATKSNSITEKKSPSQNIAKGNLHVCGSCMDTCLGRWTTALTSFPKASVKDFKPQSSSGFQSWASEPFFPEPCSASREARGKGQEGKKELEAWPLPTPKVNLWVSKDAERPQPQVPRQPHRQNHGGCIFWLPNHIWLYSQQNHTLRGDSETQVQGKVTRSPAPSPQAVELTRPLLRDGLQESIGGLRPAWNSQMADDGDVEQGKAHGI